MAFVTKRLAPVPRALALFLPLPGAYAPGFMPSPASLAEWIGGFHKKAPLLTKPRESSALEMNGFRSEMENFAPGMESDASGMESDTSGMESDAPGIEFDAPGIESNVSGMESDAPGGGV